MYRLVISREKLFDKLLIEKYFTYTKKYTNKQSYSHVSVILNQGYTAQIVLTIFHSKNLTRFKLGAALFSVDNFPEIFLYLFFSLPSAFSVLFPPPPRG